MLKRVRVGAENVLQRNKDTISDSNDDEFLAISIIALFVIVWHKFKFRYSSFFKCLDIPNIDESVIRVHSDICNILSLKRFNPLATRSTSEANLG